MSGRAFIRFWWVIPIGLAAAVAAGGLTLKASEHDKSYVATSRLLVTSGEAPYLRTAVPSGDVAAPQTGTGRTDTGGQAAGATRVTQATRVPPDVDTLVRAANLYPLLIESDQVTQLRDTLFGPLDGELTAQAVYAISTPSRFLPSDVPVIELTATSDQPNQALKLANGTATAFLRWLVQQQDQAKLPSSERIQVEQILTPVTADEHGGSNYSLAILVMIVVGAAFALLVLVLDRIFPRSPRTAVEPVSVERDRPARTTSGLG